MEVMNWIGKRVIQTFIYKVIHQKDDTVGLIVAGWISSSGRLSTSRYLPRCACVILPWLYHKEHLLW